MPQRKTFLSETSRELIERSYRVRARLRETAGVEPNPIHPTDAEQGSGSSGAETIAKRY